MPQICENSTSKLTRLVVDDDAASHIFGRPVVMDLGSRETSDLAYRWLERCVKGEHPDCPPSQSGNIPLLPSRLLQVQKSTTNTEDTIRLVDKNETGERGYYATLSYCWGESQEFKTTTDNIGSMMHCILMKDLPRTIRDAVEVTRRLRLRYLWVDAFCIIQNSAVDKAKEISRMAEIYENAVVVISADRALDCREGFLGPIHESGEAIAASVSRPIPYRTTGGQLGSVMLRRLDSTPRRLQPIDSRGWTYQESLLAKRMLSFGDQMTWKCRSGVDSNYGGVSSALRDRISLENDATAVRAMAIQGWTLPSPELCGGLLSESDIIGLVHIFEMNSAVSLWENHKAHLIALLPFFKPLLIWLSLLLDVSKLPMDGTIDELIRKTETSSTITSSSSGPEQLCDIDSNVTTQAPPLPTSLQELIRVSIAEEGNYGRLPDILSAIGKGILTPNIHADVVKWIRDFWEVFSTSRLVSPQLKRDFASAFDSILFEKELSTTFPHANISLWFDIIEQYSYRDFTDPQDKLPAISSLATKLALTTGDQYIAGLWQSNLVQGLLWHNELQWHKEDARANSTTKKIPISEPESVGYVAPSWSWASSKQGVIFKRLKPSSAKVLAVEVAPLADYDPLGRLSGGSVVIQAPLKRVPLSLLLTSADSGEIEIYPDVNRRLLFDLRAMSNPGPLAYGYDPYEKYFFVLRLSMYKVLLDDKSAGLILYEVKPGTFERVGFYSRKEEDFSLISETMHALFPCLMPYWLRRPFVLQTVLIT